MSRAIAVGWTCLGLWGAALGLSTAARAAAPDWPAVSAVLASRCQSCHEGGDAKGGIDLRAAADGEAFAERFELWQQVLDAIEGGDMPPPKAPRLTPEEQGRVAGILRRELEVVARANAGDPGVVTMRRLTNAEYDYSIRDLTGQHYGLGAEFQPDGGGGEGFSNTGDVLFLSPVVLDKYLGAARLLADHATVMPGTGIVFHDHRIGLRGPEQVKAHAEQSLYVWYQQKAAPHLPGDFTDMREADYLLSCWKHRHLATPLDTLAAEAGLNRAFLGNWWNLLTGTEPKSRFLDLVRQPWRELPALDPEAPDKVPERVVEVVGRIAADLRSWNDPKKPGSGVQRYQQDADGIRPYPMQLPVEGHDKVHLCFGDLGDGNAGDVALVQKIEVRLAKQAVQYFDWLRGRIAELTGSIAVAPPEELAALKASLAELEAVRGQFGSHPLAGRVVEPHVLAVAAPRVVTLPLPAGAVSLRAEARLDFENPDVDRATIQWVARTGSPPDVTRIIPGVLTIWKIQTEAARRTMGEFHAMRVAFPDMLERRLEEVARNTTRSAPGYTVYYFSDQQLGEILGAADRAVLARMRQDYRLTAPRELQKSQQDEFDSALIGHLHGLAARAWRRPLLEAEAQSLAALYRDGVDKGLDRESAAREVIVRVFVSPHFLFKAEALPASGGTDAAELPLSSWELASRLSYFLWSSIPDGRLREAAENGSLVRPDVLAAETRRMLADPRAAALADEFAGQWLRFAAFETHDGVDTTAFPEMTADIRDDMKREAVEFFRHLFLEDRAVVDIVTGRTSFLNERLATFYGIPGVAGPEFREVDVSTQHRGGLLGMGAFLTKTSRPDRTSPVLRGEYLQAVVLGHPSPPPPANVPELRQGLKPSSLREALARHREDQACAVCHDRIDPVGFALESFDPIGRRRTVDEAGGAIDDTGRMRDGTPLEGVAGLRRFLAEHDGQFLRQFARKLLGYALGRSVQPSDGELLDTIVAAIRSHDGRVSPAIIAVATSRQFMYRRGEAAVGPASPETSSP